NDGVRSGSEVEARADIEVGQRVGSAALSVDACCAALSVQRPAVREPVADGEVAAGTGLVRRGAAGSRRNAVALEAESQIEPPGLRLLSLESGDKRDQPDDDGDAQQLR